MRDLESWVEQAYAPAYRTACLILGNRADAEEAVQDAFLRAWWFRDSVRRDADVAPWIYRVLVNACHSKLRKEIPHRSHTSTGEELDELACRSPSPEALAAAADLGARVRAVLADLPEHLRVPVVLRYYAGLSEREIASVIGRRPGTVKSRLHEARRRLAGDIRLGELRTQAEGGRP